jgi:DNA-binding GntR family transcriptional regulator
VPLYFQVAQQLEELITSGKMPEGTRLENEISLADQLGLSRPTMRQAIQHLVDKGLVVRKRGVGTEVIRPQVRRQIELTSLFDDLTRANRKPRTEVLSLGTIAAPEVVALALNLNIGADVLAIERLRYTEAEPLALMHNYLPPGIAAIAAIGAQELADKGLYEVLREAGVHISIAEQTIGARKATAAEASKLKEPRGAPLLAISRSAYDSSGRAIEYGSHVFRASRYSFDLTLVAR